MLRSNVVRQKSRDIVPGELVGPRPPDSPFDRPRPERRSFFDRHRTNGVEGVRANGDVRKRHTHHTSWHTNRLTLFLVACLLLTRLAAVGTMQSVGDIAVVVNPDVPVDNLTLGELRRLLLGDREFWPSSDRVILLIRAPVARERDIVLKNVCQMTEAQFRQHWIAKVFRAETPSAPRIVYSGEMAMDIASRSPGAITFVEASQVSKGVKVVKIDGRLPGEKGYLLH